uniref:Glycosyl transferase family 1 domain-containing protein n=1 Tax=Eubacterium plexicaudatum ASF492 TaxID=1235802 RepID=N1ZX56_9FIRM
MKNILILNPYLSTLGGGEKAMGYFCRSLEEYYRNDVKIEILVFNTYGVNVFADDYIEVKDLNRRFAIQLKKTYIKKIDLPIPQNWKETVKNKHQIEKISKGYDIFVNFMFLSKHIGHAKTNIYHCFFPPQKYIKEQKGRGKALGLIYDLMFLIKYDKYISNSQYTNHWLAEFWKLHRRTAVIYPPVFSDKERKGRYEESEKKNIILSVGRFFVGTHSKKQLDMVRFFSENTDKFKDYEYHLVGSVSERKVDLAYLEQVQEAAGQVENIHIHVNCAYEELMKLYREAKIFWHATGYGIDENKEPEKMEHFGITTVEAMSYGAVPVVINKGGQKETVKEGVNGFRWDTQEECADKTYKLIKDDRLRKQMAEEAVKNAGKYSIEEFDRRNREVFHELGI